MSNITDWIKWELYPALYENIDRALPEFSFKRVGSTWMSELNRDLSKPKGKRRDKTVIKSKAPGLIIENGERGSIGIIDYIKERDRVEFIQAVRTLADKVGLQLPNSPSYDPEAYQRYKDQATLLEDCNSYFTYCLENSPGADEVRKYLETRGYSSEDVKAMELGYIPGQDKLFKYLLSKGYDQTLIDETLKLNKGIGSTHRLTIPYRSGGSIRGFKFRTVGDATLKYLNSSGEGMRTGGFFNLLGIKGDKDLVIVEGELDSLHATVKGIENVVATGGSSVNPEQVKDAKRRGAKKFSICFDTEPGKEEETAKKINSVIEVILAEGVNSVYIVNLPDLGGGKTDPDRLLKESGAEALKTAIAQAKPYYEYKLLRTIFKFDRIAETEKRKLYPKEIDSLLDEVVETASTIPDAIHKDRYKKLFISLGDIRELGISKESWEITIDRLTSTKSKEAQAYELKRLLSEAGNLETDKALELLDKKLIDVRAITGKGLLPPPMSYTALMDEIATLPPAYKTGYSSLDSFVGFTPGAISLIAGRPSHGKTTLLFNLLLEMSRIYRGESFYFFTYEEPVKNLSVKLLNRLTATDLSGYYRDQNLPKPTNYEFIKAYIKAKRKDIKEIEEGKELLRELIDSQRIKVIDVNYSVEQLASLIAYLQKKERIGGVFIDYIQRMRTERRTQDKRTEIAHISDQVLQIAKESGLPIILGAQLNRATLTSGNKKPTLENLKEAGNLEEDSNTVLSVYNESREKAEDSEGSSYAGVREVELEIKALKNREGEVNKTALLKFDKYTGVIKDW